jgi:hypothetical protein
VRFDEATMAHWRHDTGDFSSRCGFCDEVLSSWGERADHIAAHFKAGQTMAEWVGDWGLESAVLERVENAIPPCESYVSPFEGLTSANTFRPHRVRAQHPLALHC